MSLRLKTLKQLQATGQVPFSKPKVMQLIDEGKFPKPAMLGRGCKGHLWNEEDVERDIAKLVASSSKNLSAEKLEQIACAAKTKVMQLLDKSSGLMKCRVCGDHHNAQINPGTGRYYRGSWQCQHGCQLSPAPSAEQSQASVPL